MQPDIDSNPQNTPIACDIPGMVLVGPPFAVGGMGEIIECFDENLRRHIAAKVLLKSRAADENSEHFANRLRREAFITAELQHPGVPAVHGIGELADGRPFFLMDLLSGRTLEERLFAQPADKNEFAYYRRELLDVFLKICQTLAFAHKNRVVHRDLKPSNVFIDDLGDVKVIDWGLAKHFFDQNLDQHWDFLRNWEEDEFGKTRDDLILGTPGYLSPEQAGNEEFRSVDRTSDVFALGLILVEILTGKPAYQTFLPNELMNMPDTEQLDSEDGERISPPESELVRMCRERDLEDAASRLLQVEEEFQPYVALAELCLALNPADRPKDAEVVVTMIEKIKSNAAVRLREAQDARVAAETRVKWSRLLLVATVATVLLLVGWRGTKYRLDRVVRKNENIVQGELVRAEEEIKYGAFASPPDRVKHYEKANLHLDLVVKLGAPNKAKKLRPHANIDAARADQELLRTLVAVVRSPVLAQDGGSLQASAEQPAEQIKAAFLAHDMDLASESIESTVELVQSRPKRVFAEIVCLLDMWALNHLVLNHEQTSACDQVLRLLDALDPNSKTSELRRRAAAAQVDPTEAFEFRTELNREAKDLDVKSESALKIIQLSRLLFHTDEQSRESAIELIERAIYAQPKEVLLNLAMSELLTQIDPVSWDRVVEFCRASFALRPDTAIRLAASLTHAGRIDEAITIVDDILEASPKNQVLLTECGVIYLDGEQFEKAEGAFSLAMSLGGESPGLLNNLALSKAEQGKHTDAEQHLRRALELDPEFIPAKANLVTVLQSQSRHDEALDISKKVVEESDDPARELNNQALVLHEQQLLDEAETAARKAVEARETYANAHNTLGLILKDAGRTEDALVEINRALELDPGLKQAYLNRAILLRKRGLPDEAMRAVRRALEIDADYVKGLCVLSALLRETGNLPESLREAQAAAQIASDVTEPHLELANYYLSLGDTDRAQAEIRTAHEIDPRDPNVYFTRGMLMLSDHRPQQAVEAFRKVLELKPTRIDARVNAGVALSAQRRFAEAIKEYSVALESGETSSAFYQNFANALINSRQIDRAVEVCTIRVDAHPKDADAHIQLGVCHAMKKDLRVALEHFSEAIELDPQSALAHYNRGLALQLSGKLPEALEAMELANDLSRKVKDWPYPTDSIVRQLQAQVRKQNGSN